MSRYTLLTSTNPKVLKGEVQGYYTAILHLSPANRSGWNMCPMASDGCINACLNTAGRGGMFKAGTYTNAVQEARIARTHMYMTRRAEFMGLLVRDIEKVIRDAAMRGLNPAIRLNGTSDVQWEHVQAWPSGNVFELFHNVQFYDYTKIAKRMISGGIPRNYHLTFSLSEDNETAAAAVLAAGGNVAVVFGGKFPTRYMGHKVIDGDVSDLRFLDEAPVIVGLKAKGRARKDESGFVKFATSSN